MVNLKYLLSILSVCLSFLSVGLESVTFKGQVLTEGTNEAIPFANVYISSIDLGTTTNLDGSFEISADLPEQLVVRISAQNFETNIYTVKSSEYLNARLSPTHIDFEEVIISTPGSEIDNLNIFSVEKIRLNDGAAVNATNLTEAIANINGVQNASIGPGISKPVIRGLQGLRVLTLVNGVRIDNQQWGADHGIAVNRLGIESVEVIKGPSSLLYGSDAFAGVIYLKDAAFSSQNTMEVSAGTRFESVNMGTQSHLMYKISKNNVRFTAGGLYGNYADYQLPNGMYLSNSRFKQIGGKTTFAYNKGNYTTNVRYTYSRSRAGIPGHTHDSIFTAETFQTNKQERRDLIPTQIAENHIISWQNKWFLKKGEFKTQFSHTQNVLKEFEEKVTIAALNSRLTNTLLNLTYTHKFGNRFNLITGTQSYFQTHVNGKHWADQLILDYNQWDNGIYALGIYSLEKIKVQFGARIDHRILEVVEENFKENYVSPNFSVGISNKDQKNHFRANLSSGYRAPHASELFADGAHHGALRVEQGDINLVPEQSYQIDLSYEKKAEHISAIINPHYSYLTNYITLEQQDTLIDNLPVFNYIQFDEAQLFGVDFSIHYHPHFLHPLHIQSGYSYVRAASLSGINFNLIPQAKWDNFIQYKFNSKKNFAFEDINVHYQYFFEQNKVGNLETVSPDYHNVNIGINLKYKNLLTLALGLKNVLNASFTNHLSRLKNINTPQEGRNYFIQVNYKFKNKVK